MVVNSHPLYQLSYRGSGRATSPRTAFAARLFIAKASRQRQPGPLTSAADAGEVAAPDQGNGEGTNEEHRRHELRPTGRLASCSAGVSSGTLICISGSARDHAPHPARQPMNNGRLRRGRSHEGLGERLLDNAGDLGRTKDGEPLVVNAEGRQGWQRLKKVHTLRAELRPVVNTRGRLDLRRRRERRLGCRSGAPAFEGSPKNVVAS